MEGDKKRSESMKLGDKCETERRGHLERVFPSVGLYQHSSLICESFMSELGGIMTSDKLNIAH